MVLVILSPPDPDPSVPLIRSVRRGDIVQPTITRWSNPPQLQPTRRLQQGWWPDAQNRTEMSFRAMQDLRGETFVSIYLISKAFQEYFKIRSC